MLVIALAFIALWVRSDSNEMIFQLTDHTSIVSFRGELFRRVKGIAHPETSDFGFIRDDSYLPYRVTVSLLIFVSAYLLIRKPPVAKPKARDENPT